MMHSHAVENAMAHYQSRRWGEIRSFVDLCQVISRYSDDKVGNTQLAQHLWGNNHWTRASPLRGLVAYFGSINVTSQEALTGWARHSDFARDFEGKVPGLGFAVYQWLVMRQGVETVKPDVHLRRFLTSIIGRDLPDEELVSVLEKAAPVLGLKAYELDWRIWEYQRERQ